MHIVYYIRFDHLSKPGMEYAKDHIRINTIFPGAIDTPMVSTAMTDEALRYLLKLVPMYRIGKPFEIAYGALYFACEESYYATGANLLIDGRWTIP